MGKLAEVVDVSDCKDISTVLKKSNTAWEPAVKPIAGIKEHPKSQGITVVSPEGFHAIVRPDTMQTLGICSSRYRPNSHVVHLAKLDNMVKTGALVPERVSLWDSGRLMAFQFRAPVLDAEIQTSDRVSPLLTLAFFNDGKHGDMSFFADFRWACTNQLGKVADANSGNGRAAHRGDIFGKYEEMLYARIDDMKKVSATRYQRMRTMLKRSIGGQGLVNYWTHSLFGPEKADIVTKELFEAKPEEKLSAAAKQVKGVLAAYRGDDCGAPGSVWQAYNAITSYITHAHGRTAAARGKNALISNSTNKVLDSAYTAATRIAV